MIIGLGVNIGQGQIDTQGHDQETDIPSPILETGHIQGLDPDPSLGEGLGIEARCHILKD